MILSYSDLELLPPDEGLKIEYLQLCETYSSGTRGELGGYRLMKDLVSQLIDCLNKQPPFGRRKTVFF